MWLKSVELKNIKGFREQKIICHNRNNPYKWITLLGENGVGKSTLLQAIALLLAGPDAAKKLISSPQSWVRNDSEYGQLTATIQKNNDDNGIMINPKGRNKFSYDYSYFFIGNKNTRIAKENYPANTINPKNSETLEWLRTNAFTLDSQGWFAAGYGPFRRLSRAEENPVRLGQLKRKNRGDNFTTQFIENQSLSTFQEWMVFLDYRIAKNPDDVTSQEMKRLGEEAIIELLPGNITIDQVTNDGIIIFSLENQVIPITQLSDGFRGIIALAGDLIWRLLQTFSRFDDDPRQASGIVLIDELDIHLHPVWQRLIAKKLRSVFPNIQFFVATHSPFITAGAGDDALTLKLKMINGEAQIEEVENIAAYDFDYILRSPAFGLVSTHSPHIQDKIDRYDYLTSMRNNLQEDEMEEYETLKQFMKEFKPIGGKPEPGSLEDKINRFLEENLR